ncbi:uncharacterized protein HMPREF1541_02614 [Cyphellophora europaea CBS 101466]|uniref:Uncharacterized protein n=1 Tax=Cyphellophora europaea (strain CBS 101466) TaxID=1220924 RepID=W2S4E2_CYPE1|nr:uncharacterized protein HMPREF1541_02614 [Cyphellophora europaea CBS 101466]ETN43455.1 hypothetical protein HMPREF1541_02614 [Cyphellophora europaea CBS 101466]
MDDGKLASCTIEVPLFPTPTRLPVNGFNGSLHDILFFTPSYRPDPYFADPFSTPITWSMIDAYGSRVAVHATSRGTCLGLLLTTLLYVLFITPQQKRWKRFHICLLLALITKVIDLLIICATAALPNVGYYPSYPFITNDLTGGYSSSYLSSTLARALLDIISTLCMFACLYIQAIATLAALRLTHRRIYWCLNIYLLLAAVAVLLTRLLLFVTRAYALCRQTSTPGLDLVRTDRANVATNTLALLSYCIVAICSVGKILRSRRSILLHDGGNKSYDSALALMALVLLESFVAPLVLTVMYIMQSTRASFATAETFILPVVLVVLPFGGLFSGTAASAGRREQQPARNGRRDRNKPITVPSIGPTMQSGGFPGLESERLDCGSNQSNARRLGNALSTANHELATIDAL